MTDPALKIDLVPDRNADLALVAQAALDLDLVADPGPDLDFRSPDGTWFRSLCDYHLALYFSYKAHAGSLLISKATIKLCVSVGLKFKARKIPKQGLLERSVILILNDKSASLICFNCKLTGTREAPEKELQTSRPANALWLQSTPSRQGDKPEYLENRQENLSDH